MAQQNFEASAPENEPVTSMGNRSIAPRKQQFNIYTVILLLSFVFMLLGTIFLFIEKGRYSGEQPWKTSVATPATTNQ